MCRQSDMPMVCRWSLALCPCGWLGRGTDSPGERAQKAAGPELSSGPELLSGPELSSGPRFSLSPAFAGRCWWIM